MPGNYYENAGPSQTQVGVGPLAERQGLQNLLTMLQNQGRVDPRLLASLQAQSARSTQQQQDAARAAGARGGMSGGGLNAALQAAIGAAGANRSANLGYQDIADSYGRNQQNIGLMNQVVQGPAFGYSGLQQGGNQYLKDLKEKQRAATMAFAGSLFGAVGGAAAGGK